MYSKTGQVCIVLMSLFAIMLLLSPCSAIDERASKGGPEIIVESSDAAPCMVLEEEPPAAEPVPEPAGRYEAVAASITDKDKALTALTIYHESRGESYEGQRAVAEVIFNRALSDRWPNLVGDVIYQKGQFACSGVLTTSAIREPGCLAAAFEVAEDVLQEKEYALPAHYCFFQTKKPRTEDYIKIGNHYFY